MVAGLSIYYSTKFCCNGIKSTSFAPRKPKIALFFVTGNAGKSRLLLLVAKKKAVAFLLPALPALTAQLVSGPNLGPARPNAGR